MNIFNYFKDKGIDAPDISFYKKIEEWDSWYRGNVRNFSFYKVYTGQGNYTRRKRKTLGMAKRVCEDIADLLLNERVKIKVAGEKNQEFADKILQEAQFWAKGNEYQERKAYTGTVAYIPYLYDMVVSEEGDVLDAKIGINYVSAQNIFPVSWHNGIVTECIFIFPKTYMRKKYIQIQYHKKEDNGLYVIENSVIEDTTGSQTGKELSEEEWKKLKPFRNLSSRLETLSEKPQFVIDKLNIVNNADTDETNPMGISIYANAIDVLKELDNVFDSYDNEFTLGKKRIFVAPEMLKNINGDPAFDPEDTVFYKLPDDYAEQKDGKTLIEVNMELRTEQHSQAINDGLNYLSMKCGFGTNRYRFDKSTGGVKTATEVISENSDMFRMLRKHEIILDSALKELVRIILRLGIVTGNNLTEDAEINIEFDDSIIEDKQAERATDRHDVSMGAMQLWEYRAKWYAEDEAKAKASVLQPEETIE